MTLFSPKAKFGNFFKRTQSSSEAVQFGRDPSFDWRMLCVSFLVLMLGAITVSVVVYGRVDKEDIFLTEKEKPTSLLSLDKFKLERAVLFYENKRERFETLKRKPLSTVDPFIPQARAREN